MRCIRWRSNKYRSVRNWFANFRSVDTTLKDEPGMDVLQTLTTKFERQYRSKMHVNQNIARVLNTSQSTIYFHLEKLGNVSNLGVCVPHNVSERNKEDRLWNVISLLSQVKSSHLTTRTLPQQTITFSFSWKTFWMKKPLIFEEKVNKAVESFFQNNYILQGRKW